MKIILVTESAGFIGSNLVLRLLSEARACSHSEESKQASLFSRSNAATKKSNELFAHCYSKLYDIPTTYADATALERDFGFTPKITLREGLRKFAEWYKSYYCSDV